MSSASSTLYIDQIPGQTRAVCIKGERPVTIDIFQDSLGAGGCFKGDVYVGQVVNIVPSLQAAFVKINDGPNGFLPVKATDGDDISKSLTMGQKLLVQVRTPARDDKGPVLSCKFEFPGQGVIMTPQRKGINVSQKITDEAVRANLKEIAEEAMTDECGMVFRTQAASLSPDLLKNEVTKLAQIWGNIQESKLDKPGLVWSNQSVIALLADKYKETSDLHVVIDSLANIAGLQEAFPMHERVERLFETKGLNEVIEETARGIVDLSDGTRLDIEKTSALIAVDVNAAARTQGRNSAEADHQTNLLAMRALKDHIILKNLGGQIYVDLIGLAKGKQRDALRDAITELFSETDITFHGFTRLGLAELTRPTNGPTLAERITHPLYAFFQLMRELAKGGLINQVLVGDGLYTIWHGAKNDETKQWLVQRLGYMPEIREEKTFAPNQFEVEKR